MCVCLIHELLEGNRSDWTSDITWVVYPVLNPDGYDFSWRYDRLWRKNRNLNGGHRCKGVDLNRNYDANHLAAGSSSDPCASAIWGFYIFLSHNMIQIVLAVILIHHRMAWNVVD